MGVAQGIMDDGFAGGDAVDIINAAVENYCYRHWELLTAIGRLVRAENASARTKLA